MEQSNQRMNGAAERMERKIKLANLEDKRTELDERLDFALNRYLEFREQYGDDHTLTRFQAQMLNILTPMNELCMIVLTMQEGMEALDETMLAIDDALDIINECFDNHAKRYSVFDNLRQRRRMRKYWKTFQRRVKRIFDVYSNMMTNTDKLRKFMDKVSVTISAAPKTKKNKGAAPAPTGASAILTPEAKALVDKKLASSSESETGVPRANGAVSAPSADGGNPGVDDIV